LDTLISRVCTAYGVDARDLTKKARRNKFSIAKSLICYWGAEELGLTMLEIGLTLEVSRQSVSKRAMQGRACCQSENISLDSLLR